MLTEFGLPREESLVIRRIISSRGKSRFYVNGAMATAKVVSELAEHLLCVASQHDHQQLLHPNQHLAFLDLAGDLAEQREAMENAYDVLKERREALQKLRESERQALQRRDLLTFQVNEIEQAALAPGEEEELEIEKNRLRSSEQLQSLGEGCYQALDESALVALQQVRKDMERMASLDETIAALAEKIAGISYELEDNTGVLRNYLDELPHDPERLEAVGERLHLISQLKKKYGAGIAEILAFGERAARELELLNNREHDLAALQGSGQPAGKAGYPAGRGPVAAAAAGGCRAGR